MNVLTDSKACANVKQAMDAVCRDHDPMLITRQKGEHVVMLSLNDYNSMQETLFLLSSPANVQRLTESIAQVRAGNARIKGLITNEQTESKE